MAYFSKLIIVAKMEEYYIYEIYNQLNNILEYDFRRYCLY